MLLRPSRSPRVCHSLQCRHEDRYVSHSCKSWHRSGRCVHLVWSRAEFAVGCKLLDSFFSSPTRPIVCFRLGSSRFPGDEGQTPSRSKADPVLGACIGGSCESNCCPTPAPPPPPKPPGSQQLPDPLACLQKREFRDAFAEREHTGSFKEAVPDVSPCPILWNRPCSGVGLRLYAPT